MTPVTRPRGPLPKRVYWIRRLLVMGVAAALVAGVAQLLSLVPDEAPTRGQASPAGAPTSSPVLPGGPIATVVPAPRGKKARRLAAQTSAAALPAPEGTCAPDDVRVRADLDTAFAATDIEIPLQLSTVNALACTWSVSPDTLLVNITSGADLIWTTDQCKAAIPQQEVVVRRDTPTLLSVVWGGQRSDEECSRSTSWAEPGLYEVIVTAIGGEPVGTQFELTRRPQTVITKTRTPKPKASADASASADTEAQTDTTGRSGD